MSSGLVRYNPCGRFVDFGRWPFKSKVKPFAGSDEEVTVVWYPCAPDAEALPFPSLICRPEWDADGQQWAEGGQVPDAPRVFSRQKPRPGSGRGHICGTAEEFANGCVRDESLPPVAYGNTGLPACCDPVRVGAGGLGIGGSALVVTQPGSTCDTNTVLEFDQWRTFTTPPSSTSWFEWPGVADELYFIEYERLDGPVMALQRVLGGGCPPQSFLPIVVGGSCINMPFQGYTGRHQFTVVNGFHDQGWLTYRMRLRHGSCPT